MTCDKNLFALLSEGWKLFPCSNSDKCPLTKHGFKDATNDLAIVEAWGTPTSAERGVVDIDPRNGGDVTLAKLLADHGPLPPTWTTRTGGGGWHYWFRFPEGTRSGKIVDGIDRKADGGYVIVPPSRIACPEHEGRSYLWTAAPWKGAAADAPGWAVGLVDRQPADRGTADCVAHYNSQSPVADPWTVQPAADLRTHPGCGEGARRKTLCEMLAWHTANGVGSADDLYQWAGEWAGRCDPPFGEWEKHVAGYLRREREHDNHFRLPLPVLPDGEGALKE